MKMSTVCYYIPYSAKAIRLLREAERKYHATWSVDENEEVTITLKTIYLARLERLLAPVV